MPPVDNDKSITRISRHCFNVAKYLFKSLKQLKYSNGQSVVKLYHDSEFESIAEQGGIVNFNLLHDDGTFIGFAEVVLEIRESLSEFLFSSTFRPRQWLPFIIFI